VFNIDLNTYLLNSSMAACYYVLDQRVYITWHHSP